MAWSPTAQWTHPLVNIKQSNASPQLTNYLSFGLAELMTWQGLASVINKFRTKTLGLQALSNREGAGLADRLKIPFMYCWSPSQPGGSYSECEGELTVNRHPSKRFLSGQFLIRIPEAAAIMSSLDWSMTALRSRAPIGELPSSSRQLLWQGSSSMGR